MILGDEIKVKREVCRGIELVLGNKVEVIDMQIM